MFVLLKSNIPGLEYRAARQNFLFANRGMLRANEEH